MDKDRKPYADFVYNVDKLNVIFAAASVALILAVGWMIWDDYDREWKDQQRHANALEIHKTQADLKGAQQEIDQEQLAQIEADISGVERTLGEHQTEYDLAVSTLENLDGEWYSADQNLRTAKAK